MSNISIFSLWVKKNLFGSESTQVEAGSASYLLRVKSKLGLGQGPSLVEGAGVLGLCQRIVEDVIEMYFDPTWAYFWPAVNKRLTHLWPENFLTWLEEIFLIGREKNWKILGKI